MRSTSGRCSAMARATALSPSCARPWRSVWTAGSTCSGTSGLALRISSSQGVRAADDDVAWPDGATREGHNLPDATIRAWLLCGATHAQSAAEDRQTHLLERLRVTHAAVDDRAT